jgi:hypothetical protein
MATIGNERNRKGEFNGYRRILFVAPDGSRKSIRLGKKSKKQAKANQVED